MTHSPRIDRNKSADGLRGLAALSVVFAHYVAAFFPSLLHSSFPAIFKPNATASLAHQTAEFPLVGLLYNGQFAVLIFFVLSGYVLTIPYYWNDKERLLERIWGRYFRLNIPILATILISFCLLKAGLYFNDVAANLIDNEWFLKYFSMNYQVFDALEIGLMDTILQGNSALNPPLWTIKVEFVGSIVLMSVFLIFTKHHMLILILAGLLFYYYSGAWAIYYAAIFAGSSINARIMHAPAKYAVFALGVYFGAYQYQSIFYNFLPELPLDSRLIYNLIGAYLLVFAVVNGVGRKLLTRPFFQFLGKISYSLYITHFLILSSLASYIYINITFSGWNILFHFFAFVSISFLTAYLFTVLVDTPSIRLSKRFATMMNR